MDWSAAGEGIARDLGELVQAGPGGWLAIVIVMGLPVLATVVIVRGRRLAGWLALLAWFVPACWWVVYYATDLWPNLGTEGAVRSLGGFLAGWLVLGVDASVRRRRASNPRASLSAG